MRVYWVLLINRKGEKMQDISRLGFFVLLLGSLIYVWSKSLNRKKVISNGQEVTNSLVGTILVFAGAVMMAIPFFIE